MSRRHFLRYAADLAACSALGGCTASSGVQRTALNRATVVPRPLRRAKIRAICFDLFTIFDPRSVMRVAVEEVGPRAASLCDAWRTRHFEYTWIRIAAGQYADFQTVTEEALVYAARASNVALSRDAQRKLVSAYSELEPWPDTRATLLGWKNAGLRLAPLSNYAPAMLQRLVEHAGLGSAFDTLISTDAARTFKPDPQAYALGVSALGLEREQVAFAAFGGWDAAGARWFGYPTFWVNRLGVAAEELGPGPDAAGATLAELAAFVDGW
jgi:2-haloacid dehalogenase